MHDAPRHGCAASSLAMEAHGPASEAPNLRSLESRQPQPDNLLAKSPAMLRVKATLRKVASVPAPTVLLTGESGVGKDAAARFLHAQSDRAQMPFVNITCSALPANLLESELFGHERGAFTDARQRKQGLLEMADGGTAFLDEIGEISPALQVKLLRFLEERAFRRVGGTQDIRPNVRIVAATNRDLRQAVRGGGFRQDLYYRLAVLHLAIPPLRERHGDTELLGLHFLERYAQMFRRPIVGMTPAALERLNAHAWPGNVRELRNVIERAVLMAEGRVVDAGDISIEAPMVKMAKVVKRLEDREGEAADCPFDLPPGGVRLDQLERHLLQQALRRARGNKTHAASLLGLTRDQIRHRIAKYRLEGALSCEGEQSGPVST